MKFVVSRNFFIILALDLFLLCLSFYLSHMVRFEFSIPEIYWKKFIELLPYVLVIKIAFFYYFDLYRGMWRYTGLNDLLNVLKATIGSSVLLVLFVLWKYRFEHISRSVFFIDLCFTLIFTGGLRILTRLSFEKFSDHIDVKDFGKYLLSCFFRDKNSIGVLIAGAGPCGEKICKEIKENSAIPYIVTGFVDDNPAKIGRKIHGIPVVHHIDKLEDAARATGASEVIIATPSSEAVRMREIIGFCKKAGLKFKTVPGMGELINGNITVNAIRDVEYRDLLGRKPVVLDDESIGSYLRSKTILVTGAGGSIGSGLCRQIARYSPACIVLFERAESPLYEIELELKRECRGTFVFSCLGDIQKREELDNVFGKFKPEIVFHAAAYKHVPMLETQPWKAVENNILGTANLADMADLHGCEKFVFVSTDKAVNPVNIMGVSKRVCEMIVQNRNVKDHSRTSFMTVRFGNVIGSVGSVIPLFKKQIKMGGPVTVTHPDVIRYFMLIPEACQLILQAGAMGHGGEIFILEMGRPIKIDEMAKDLIRFSGFEPDVDIKIEYTGLRLGEKLYEELMTDAENVLPTRHESIMVLNCERCDMKMVNGSIEGLKNAAMRRDAGNIKDILKSVVPEYDTFQKGAASQYN